MQRWDFLVQKRRLTIKCLELIAPKTTEDLSSSFPRQEIVKFPSLCKGVSRPAQK